MVNRGGKERAQHVSTLDSQIYAISKVSDMSRMNREVHVRFCESI